jgi:hypothetical protein
MLKDVQGHDPKRQRQSPTTLSRDRCPGLWDLYPWLPTQHSQFAPVTFTI